jgi:hypothetical protein
LICSFKNDIHSCFNLREKINKHNTRGVKEKLPSANTPRSALRERQFFSPLRARVQLPIEKYNKFDFTTVTLDTKRMMRDIFSTCVIN